jgi:hypothetical protein
MNYKLALSGLFCVVFISACSSAPKLPEPSGSWEDFNPPVLQASQVKGGGSNAAKK